MSAKQSANKQQNRAAESATESAASEKNQAAAEPSSNPDKLSKKPSPNLDKNSAGSPPSKPQTSELKAESKDKTEPENQSKAQQESNKVNPVAKKITPDDKAAPPPPNEPPKNKGNKFLYFLVLLLFVGVAFLSWWGYQQLTNLQSSVQTNLQTSFQGQLKSYPTHQELRASLSGLNAIDGLENRQNYLQQTLNNHQVELVNIQQALVKSNEPKPRDWQLAEAEYLLRLANQRLQIEEDIDGALALMRTADQRLKEASVPGTLGVRSYLLEDIEELKALPRLDKVSIALSLQALADQALSLKTEVLATGPSLNLDAVMQLNAELNWYEHLWQEIRSLVIVRQRDLPVEALPFAADELALRHQLSALLLQASWAALRGEQPLYNASLTAANKRLAGFDARQPEVLDFTQQLTDLLDQPVRQTLPEIQASLDSLQAFIAQRYSLQLPLDAENLDVKDSDAKQVDDQPITTEEAISLPPSLDAEKSSIENTAPKADSQEAQP